MGRAINKTVMIAELNKRRIAGLHQNTSVRSTDITDTLKTTRHFSVITIIFSKKEPDTSSSGYQPPISADQVKPWTKMTTMEHAGREHGGHGRGRGNRNNGVIENTEMVGGIVDMVVGVVDVEEVLVGAVDLEEAVEIGICNHQVVTMTMERMYMVKEHLLLKVTGLVKAEAEDAVVVKITSDQMVHGSSHPSLDLSIEFVLGCIKVFYASSTECIILGEQENMEFVAF